MGRTQPAGAVAAAAAGHDDCLNGYFVAPSFESLSESLVKAEMPELLAVYHLLGDSATKIR